MYELGTDQTSEFVTSIKYLNIINMILIRSYSLIINDITYYVLFIELSSFFLNIILNIQSLN